MIFSNYLVLKILDNDKYELKRNQNFVNIIDKSLLSHYK